MLRVALSQAIPGMRLAMPLAHPERPTTTLLRGGFTLDERTIERIRTMPISELWIEHPDFGFLEKYVSPEISRCRGEMLEALQGVFSRFEQRGELMIDYDAFRELVRNFVRKLTEDMQACLYVETLALGPYPMARHSVETCFLSLLMGLKLDAYLINQRSRLAAHRAKDIVNLGVGALLHDIGLALIEPEGEGAKTRLKCAGASSLEELDQCDTSHAELGYEFVKGSLDASAANTILQHHQRFDGSGFPHRDPVEPGEEPRGYMGDEIHIFARILAAADLFDSLRAPKEAGGLRRPAVVAFKRMVEGPESAWLDPVVVRALLAVCPPYPPGSIVTLNNGAVCAVVGLNSKDPCRPPVQVVRAVEEIGEDSGSPTEYILAERGDLQIAHIDGDAVLAHNFYPTEERQFEFNGGDVEIAA